MQQHPYLCARRFTAADMAVGQALRLAQHLGINPQRVDPTPTPDLRP